MSEARIPFSLKAGEKLYSSAVWPGLVLEWRREHLLLEFPAEAEGLSSAVYGGGMVRLKRAVNQFVSRDYECSNPVRDMEIKLREWGYPLEGCAGLMTAVPLEHAAVAEEDTGSAGIFCCVTAASGNAARAGVERSVLAAYRPGTINIMLGIDGRLTPSAMVNAVMTAAEAKAAALADLGVTDPENGLIATGTTTDAVLLAVSGSGRYGAEHVYAGTATDLGGAIGRLVYAAVTASLRSAKAAQPVKPSALASGQDPEPVAIAPEQPASMSAPAEAAASQRGKGSQ
ncbi:adenosylcobinamide amidohydrolase [Paenibacillus sp. S150]|uniref:adenosylcobinamide amidohydrolase n=1 Tax=Paenibacillus sp. S150 TaxID=2749826 RepID=UPI001C59F1C9|nr:adenosylcobinamide amidohydrolase [Paenibacillus sp. S150]MBW4083478.1 adenosylcobinamide amidohydrolase [Paenibacillus sp. S150]